MESCARSRAQRNILLISIRTSNKETDGSIRTWVLLCAWAHATLFHIAPVALSKQKCHVQGALRDAQQRSGCWGSICVIPSLSIACCCLTNGGFFVPRSKRAESNELKLELSADCKKTYSVRVNTCVESSYLADFWSTYLKSAQRSRAYLLLQHFACFYSFSF